MRATMSSRIAHRAVEGSQCALHFDFIRNDVVLNTAVDRTDGEDGGLLRDVRLPADLPIRRIGLLAAGPGPSEAFPAGSFRRQPARIALCAVKNSRSVVAGLPVRSATVDDWMASSPFAIPMSNEARTRAIGSDKPA